MPDPTLQTIGLGLAAAAKVLQSLKDLVSAPDARAQISQLYDMILSAQSGALEAQLKERRMLDTIDDLEKELARVKAWEETKKRYVLINPRNGFFAYTLKASSQPSEPAHFICAKCYEDGKKSILQGEHVYEGRKEFQVCHRCSTKIQTGHSPLKPEYAQ